MENLATSLPLRSKLSGKFQHSDAIDGSMELLNFQKFQLKWIIYILQGLNRIVKYILQGRNSEPP